MRTSPLMPLALLAVLTVAACGGSSPSDSGSGGTITIGSLHPLTGALAVDGQQMDNAVKLAVDEVNTAGGIKSLGGAKLKVAAGDTQGKPEVGQSEAQRLISAGAVALVGPFQSAVAAQVAAVAERSAVPFVIDVATADGILAQGYKYTFRIQPNASAMGTEGAKYLVDVAKSKGITIKKVGYLHEQSAFGTTVMKAFSAEASKLGVTVGPVISYDAFAASDLKTEVARIKAAHVDALAVTGYYRDGLLVAKNVASVAPGVKAVFGVANGAFDVPTFPKDGGSASDGYFDANYHADVTKPAFTKLAAAFKAKYNADIRTAAVLSYEAVKVIAAGLEKAGSKDRTKLRAAISGLSLTSLMASKGNIEFTDKGENKNAIPILMQVQGPDIKQVFPANVAQSPLRFPAAR